MKKMFLILGIIVAALFLVGCAKAGEEAIAGEAIKFRPTPSSTPPTTPTETAAPPPETPSPTEAAVVVANSCNADSVCEVEALQAKGVSVEGLEGDGTAYVCVFSNGKLFRSATPCS